MKALTLNAYTSLEKSKIPLHWKHTRKTKKGQRSTDWQASQKFDIH